MRVRWHEVECTYVGRMMIPYEYDRDLDRMMIEIFRGITIQLWHNICAGHHTVGIRWEEKVRTNAWDYHRQVRTENETSSTDR